MPTRRTVLKFGLAAAAIPAMRPLAYAAEPRFAPQANGWRTFEVTTAVALPEGQGTSHIWLPIPDLNTAYQRDLGSAWTGNAATSAIVTDADTGIRMLHAEFAGDTAAPVLTLTSRVEARNRVVDWSSPTGASEDPAILAAALAPSTFKPLDGIVRETALAVTKGATTDVEKVRALYDWMVATCHRDLDTPGCGPGDIVATLAANGFGGKCADLNGLFVGMARAVGVPARDIYGVRVAPSAFGYKQLGANSPDITGAQHCRAEVWLGDYGWVAMDPADVLKVMRQETADWIKDAGNPLVAPVRDGLFGNWEGNWIGWNTAEDVGLPGSGGASLPFLMYPQGQNATGRLNELAAKDFHYTMTARELTA